MIHTQHKPGKGLCFKPMTLLVICVSLCVSSQTYALQKATGFQNFLEAHYQSQSRPLPAIPPYSLVKPLAVPSLHPHLRVIGLPSPVPVLEPKLSLPPREEHTDKLENNWPKLAIVIDDIGNNKNLDSQVARLPGAITLAVLPHTPHSKTIARLGHANHKEIMLHAPMESLNNRRLGDGALTKELSDEQFMTTLQEGIDSIPHIAGLNNHMGSALTQDERSMHLVMQSVKQNNLYFVDSRTTPESIAGDLASEYQIDNVTRNIFLDNETNQEYIDTAFKRAIEISKNTGFALAIGHPYPDTINYLQKAIPKLEKQGIKLISVSELLSARAGKKNRTVKDLAKN